MKHKNMVIALVVASVTVMAAQNAPVIVTTADTPNGHKAVVTNQGQSAITALVLQTTVTVSGKVKGRATEFLDTAINFRHDKPIPPAGAQQFPTGVPNNVQQFGPDAKITGPEIKIAMFADGTTYGDSTWADVVAERRKAVSTGLGVVKQTLAQASQQGWTRDATIAAFNDLKDKADAQIRADKTAPAVASAAKLPYSWAINNVKDTRVDGAVPAMGDLIAILNREIGIWEVALSSGGATSAAVR